MSSSPPSGYETGGPLPPDPRRQKPTPMTRRRQKNTVAKSLALFAALAILVLGSACFGSLSAYWVLTRVGEVTGPGPITSSFSDDLSTQSTQPETVQEITEPPAIAVPHGLQNVSFVTPFAQPESIFIPARVIVDTPIATPTTSASPTATSLPPVTDTPTATPTASASPAVASLPTVTLTPTLTVTLQTDIVHVVIISIDGLRPDALLLTDTPSLDNLIAKGAYSPSAQTVKISVTLPSHASMLGGMIPEKHGILWGTPYIGWPGMAGPTLFNVAHDAGLSTGMIFGKQKLHYLVLSNSVDELFGADVHDPEVKERAVEVIEAGLPNVLFIHFPDVDRVGHAYGWMSENQFQSITYVDGLIGEIVAALDSGGYLCSTLLIISSDHGGHGFGHGDDSPEDRTIPWLATGPGVPSGVTLTSHINTYDTAATVLYALDLPLPENWDGQPVLEILP